MRVTSSLASAPRRPAALLLALALAAAPALSSGNPAAARNAADSAMTRERFCDAAYLYKKLDELSADATTTLKAAEALAQGGDRAGAVALLEAFPVRFPGHPLSGGAAKRLELIRAAIGKVGPGSTCPAPDPVCGNGLVEGSETCDDGNRVDADSCPATCTTAGAAPVVTPPVVTPPVVTPPVVTPPVVTPPVVTPTPPTTTTSPTTTTTSPTTTTTSPTTTTPPDEEPSTTDRLPDDGATPQPTTIEPVPPPTTPTEEPAPTTEEPLEEVPAGPGPPIAGIALSAVGGIVAVAGTGAVVLGLMPAISYFAGSGGQAAAVAQYEAADGNAERRDAAGAAADAYAAQARDATAWNNQGRWLLLGGTGGLAAGAGLLVGGILLIANHGGEPGEDGDDDDDDDKDDDDKDDDADEREEH